MSTAIPTEPDSQWLPPASAEEADERRRETQERIERVQAQLGDATRRAMYDSEDEYHAWRREAKGALRHFTAENRLLRDWRRERNIADSRDTFKPDEGVQMAYAVARRMRALAALQYAVAEWVDSGVVPVAVAEAYRAVGS